MPAIVCIMLFLIMYLFLREDNKYTYKESEEYINCNGCGSQVGISYDFCQNCNEKLKEDCPHCKKKISVNWRYCPYCATTKEKR